MTSLARSRLGRTRARRVLPAVVALALAGLVIAVASSAPGGLQAARDFVTILGSKAVSLDPAVQADSGSAQVVAQLFESLTAVDAAQRVQPALAARWETLDSGTRVVFHLRPDLAFSDGSPLSASDVVTSWMRVLAPSRHAQLASLLDDVVGAADYRAGTGTKAAVGLHALNATDVEVRLRSPAADFPAIASSPTLAVVPAALDSNPSLLKAGSFVGSGGYVLEALTSDETTLAANAHYWAGKPAIGTIHVKNNIGGKSPVDEFGLGNLDFTPISSFSATWIAYDRTLGPDLRTAPSPTVEYYGFDTTRPPFDNAHVRHAFEIGIDWRRMVTLVGDPAIVPATGMVPPGIPGRSGTDFGPKFDVAAARAELAAGGYPNGAGFPRVTLVTAGTGLDAGVVRQLHDNLGIDIAFETLDGDSYNQRLLDDPPAMWSMGWAADYPGADDFLGLLLGTGQTNNFGRWTSPAFDAAIGRALAATDATQMQAAFDAAQAIVRDDAPVIPVDYGADYSLVAKGLLGAAPNGQGLVRYAGLAWAAGT